MLHETVLILSAIAKLLMFPGITWGFLWFCLCTTRDYRLRRRFSDATRHLLPEELVVGREKNAAVLAAYYASVAKAHRRELRFTSLKRKVLLRRAKPALIMMTVLDEHLAATQKIAPGPRYLRSRMRIIDEMRR